MKKFEIKDFVIRVINFIPLLIFFVIYFRYDQDLMLAIPPFIVATLVALAIAYFLEKKVSMMLLMGGIIITLFGGLALYFDNKIFFYMKPTVISLLFAGALFLGKLFTKKPLIKILFQGALKDLEEERWQKLNNRFIYFFIFLAILNEIVWRTQSEPFWVNFKVWGILPINFLFILSQFSLISGGKELKLQENSTTAKIDDTYFDKFRKKDKLRTTQEIKKGILNDNE